MKRTGIFIFAAALALTGCSIQDGSFENKMFINADNYRSEVRVATDEGVKTLTRNLSVSVAKPLDNDIDVTVVKSPPCHYRSEWSRGARESQDNVLRSERSISRKCSC